MGNPNCNTKHKNFQHLIDKERHEIEVRFNKNNGSVYRICSEGSTSQNKNVCVKPGTDTIQYNMKKEEWVNSHSSFFLFPGEETLCQVFSCSLHVQPFNDHYSDI